MKGANKTRLQCLEISSLAITVILRIIYRGQEVSQKQLANFSFTLRMFVWMLVLP